MIFSFRRLGFRARLLGQLALGYPILAYSFVVTLCWEAAYRALLPRCIFMAVAGGAQESAKSCAGSIADSFVLHYLPSGQLCLHREFGRHQDAPACARFYLLPERSWVGISFARWTPCADVYCSDVHRTQCFECKIHAPAKRTSWEHAASQNHLISTWACTEHPFKLLSCEEVEEAVRVLIR